ncbi:MAG: hypothetical protein ACOCTI_02220 [Phycisphaeraceae bacterium]
MQSQPRSRIPGLLAMLLVVTTGVWLVILLARPGRELSPITELNAGPGRTIAITAQPVLRGQIGLYYQPRTNGKAKPPPAFFGSVPPTQPPPELTVRGEGPVVGLVLADRPDDLLVLHDFETSESWPAHAPADSAEVLQARGRTLLERFQSQAGAAGELHLYKAEALRPLPVGEPADPEQG